MTPNSTTNCNQNGKDLKSKEDNFTKESYGNTINCPLS
jgi:hypothetical protein